MKGRIHEIVNGQMFEKAANLWPYWEAFVNVWNDVLCVDKMSDYENLNGE